MAGAIREPCDRYGDDLTPAVASEASNACFVRWNAPRVVKTDPDDAQANLDSNMENQPTMRDARR
jgi:hypothetical protein